MISRTKIAVAFFCLIKSSLCFSFEFTEEYLERALSASQLELMKSIPNTELINRDEISFESSTGSVSASVILLKYSAQNEYLGYCSAALISSRHVLTAKHCMTNAVNEKVFVVDDSYLKGNQNSQMAKVIGVTDKCQHPQWWCSQGNNLLIRSQINRFLETDFSGEDVVILHLDLEITSSDGYFKLPDENTTFEGIKLSMAGLPSYAINLQGNWDVKYVSQPVCDLVSTTDDVLITNCIPAGGLSGSPIFYRDGSDLVLLGIISSHIQIESSTHPGVSLNGTRAAAVYKIDFIKDFIEAPSPPVCNYPASLCPFEDHSYCSEQIEDYRTRNCPQSK